MPASAPFWPQTLREPDSSQFVRQRAARCILHHAVGSTIGGLNEFKQPYDIGMSQVGHNSSFFLESSHLFRVIEVDQEFDGNRYDPA